MSQKSCDDGMDDFTKTFTCAYCKKKYKHMRTLRHHVKKDHPNEQLEKTSNKTSKIYQYKCEECPRQFSDKYSLRSHERKVHGKIFEAKQGTLYKCALCSIETITKEDILNHFEEVHDIQLDVQNLEFDTYNHFAEWKEKFEKETLSNFVKKRGDQIAKSSKKQFFICHRSGHFVSKGKGERQLKAKGSNKIDGFCPAKIDVTLSDSKCSVELITTHVGHSNDIDHLFLTASERNSIAAKIADKVPFEVILDEVHDSVSESGMGRMHLLTKKDLFNIKSNFSLHSSIHHKEDDLHDDEPSDDVYSTSSNILDTHCIQMFNDEHCNCQLICVDCKTCIQYQCTCLDSSIKWNMCKHKHLICQHASKNTKPSISNVSSCSDFEENNLQINRENETAAILSELAKNNSTSAESASFEEQKANIKRKFMETIDKLLVPEQVEVLKNLHKTLGPTLDAVYSAANTSPND